MTPDTLARYRELAKAGLRQARFGPLASLARAVPDLCDEVERLTKERADAITMLAEVTTQREQARADAERWHDTYQQATTALQVGTTKPCENCGTEIQARMVDRSSVYARWVETETGELHDCPPPVGEVVP